MHTPTSLYRQFKSLERLSNILDSLFLTFKPPSSQEIVSTQTSNKEPVDIEELTLDPWRGCSLSPEDKSLLESFSNLQSLSFSGCGLTSLANFPDLPRLQKLELRDNQISTGFGHLSELSNLMQVGLAGNPIKYFADLRPLTKLISLVSLNLTQCPVSQCQLFRPRVFSMLPELEILNQTNRKGQPASLSEDDEEESEEEKLPEVLVQVRKRNFLKEDAREKRGREPEVILIEDSDEDSPETLSAVTKKQKAS